MDKKVQRFLDELMGNYPVLETCRSAICAAFDTVVECYRNKGKLLVCGNGGSAADAQHLVGELMKEYLLKRPLPESDAAKVLEAGGQFGPPIRDGLQGALPALSLAGEVSLFTAFANDVNIDMVFAQQVYGYGRPGDVLIAISTSGASPNVLNAARVARAFGLKSIGLTGAKGGKLKELCDVSICVPADVTWRIQEYHQPIYHALCGMVEQEFFGTP
jgi:D-sedoheptulose 7-phosphate isomerase